MAYRNHDSVLIAGIRANHRRFTLATNIEGSFCIAGGEKGNTGASLLVHIVRPVIFNRIS
jgi:hypothetical protein